MFGLENCGNLCYLNSLIQALMSCSSFNKRMLSLRQKFEDSKNTLGLEYINLYLKNKRTEPQDFDNIKHDSTKKILDEMIELRNNSKKVDNLHSGRQEDVDEGLVLMLDTLGKDIENLFYIRHEHHITCTECKKSHTIAGEPSEYMVNMSDCNPFVLGKLDTREKIQDYIKVTYDIPYGYKCDNCKKENMPKQKTLIWGYYVLKRLSSILILRFTGKQASLANQRFNTKGTTKDYENQKDLYFPEYLEFESIDGHLRYEMVAQILQSGSLSGGHYIAKCKRPCENLSYKRSKSIQNRIDTINQELIKNEKDLGNSNPGGPLYNHFMERKTDFQKELKIMQTELAQELSFNKNEEKRNTRQEIFKFNDANIKKSDEFECEKNTYLVFYHLV
jgi:ubiquitin C-terminal hydrolase